MTFKCICCNHEQEFADADAAYAAGWDAPPHFSVGPFCNLCPAAPFTIHGHQAARERHAPVHAKWTAEGRPEEFDPSVELALDGIGAEEFARFRSWLDGLSGAELSALKEKLTKALRRH